MDQRGVVKQLHGYGPLYYLAADIAEKFGAEKHHYRPDLLSLTLQVSGYYLIHQRIRRRQRSRNQIVQLLQFGR